MAASILLEMILWQSNFRTLTAVFVSARGGNTEFSLIISPVSRDKPEGLLLFSPLFSSAQSPVLTNSGRSLLCLDNLSPFCRVMNLIQTLQLSMNTEQYKCLVKTTVLSQLLAPFPVICQWQQNDGLSPLITNTRCVDNVLIFSLDIAS